METLYTGRVHGFPNVSGPVVGFYGPAGEEGVLSLVVVLTTSVSLVALVFAFITYSLFSDLRNLSGTTLMTLLSAIFMTQLIYVIGVGGVQDSELCLGIAFSLHYLHLGVMLWLTSLVKETWDSLRVDRTLRPAPDTGMCLKFFVSCLLCWGLPGVSTLAALLVTDIPNNMGPIYKLNCWFLEVDTYMYTYVVPVAALFIYNTVTLVRCRILIRYTVRLQPDPKVRSKLADRRGSQVRLCWLLVGLMFAVNWTAAIARATSGSSSSAHFPAWAAFNAVHASQGLLAALFVTCDRRVLAVYTRPAKARARKRKRGDGGGGSRRLSSSNCSATVKLLADTPGPVTHLDWRPPTGHCLIKYSIIPGSSAALGVSVCRSGL